MFKGTGFWYEGKKEIEGNTFEEVREVLTNATRHINKVGLERPCIFNSIEFKNMHTAAYLNIDDTIEALKPVLELRVKAGKVYFNSNSDSVKEDCLNTIKYSNDLIGKILGVKTG